MDEKEYKMQCALGTIDYRKAAIGTKSPKVLARLVEDCQDPDIHLLVAMNSKTDVRTLTRLVVDPNTADVVIDTCMYHPSVDLKTLEIWGKREHVCNRFSFRSRMYALQVADGVPEGSRIDLDVPLDVPPYDFPNPKIDTWAPSQWAEYTSTGTNWSGSYYSLCSTINYTDIQQMVNSGVKWVYYGKDDDVS